MAVNLIRNSRVFFTTNVDGNGRVRAGAYKNGAFPFKATNTFEIQVLDGLTFSQNTTQDTITLNEAGAAPSRGQRSFNTQLQALDFSFSTYMRPFNDTTNSKITCEERLLWNAFGSANPIGSATAAWSETASAATMSFANSNKHQLQTFGLIIIFDNSAYLLDNCALNTATIDFGIDAIGTLQWAGKGSAIRPAAVTADTSSPVNLAGADVLSGGTTENGLITFNNGLTAGQTFTVAGLTYTSTGVTTSIQLANAFANLSNGATTGGGTATGTYTGALTGYFTGIVDGNNVVIIASTTSNTDIQTNVGITGTGSSAATISVTDGSTSEAVDQAKAKNTTAQYITNKLSTMVLNSILNNFDGSASGSKQYTIALTGGQISFNNNLTYLIPSNLAQVNNPITYFTGTRAITGNVTAYLKTGTNEAGQLLADLLSGSSTTVDPKFTANIQMGGPSSNPTGVELKLPAAMLQIPQINTAAVISTTINFTAQGFTTTPSLGYDITAQNEATIVYRAAATY